MRIVTPTSMTEAELRRAAADDENVDLLGQSVGVGEHGGVGVGLQELGIAGPAHAPADHQRQVPAVERAERALVTRGDRDEPEQPPATEPCHVSTS